MTSRDSASRSPSRRNPARLANTSGSLSSLPVFLTLAKKRAVVAGGSAGAAWKAELLAAAGAYVDVYGQTFDHRMIELRNDAPDTVRLFETAITVGMDTGKLDAILDGAAIFIGDAQDEAAAEMMYLAAKRCGVPVNIIDKPDWSDFLFGSIVDRSPLLIAISTSGGAPVFAQAIRAKIETLLPDGIRRWAAAALAWRPDVMSLDLPQMTRRTLWERFTQHAFADPARKPDEALKRKWLQSVSIQAEEVQQTGSVILAGAGPGDAELMTLKTVRAMQSADVILYDDLVSAAVLDFARREAEKISVGKRGYKPSCTQEDICNLMIEQARQGKRVVRLKGGDPMIFGRAGEEISALQAAGIAVTTIPGVTAASAAAAQLGLSLTARDVSRRVQFVTAHARGGSLPEDLNWPALADPSATTIAYMGVGTLPLLSEKLLAAGMPGDTPAVLAQHVSWDSEKFIAATIATLPAIAAQQDIASPAVVIIGKIAAGKLSPDSKVSGMATDTQTES